MEKLLLLYFIFLLYSLHWRGKNSVTTSWCL